MKTLHVVILKVRMFRMILCRGHSPLQDPLCIAPMLRQVLAIATIFIFGARMRLAIQMRAIIQLNSMWMLRLDKMYLLPPSEEGEAAEEGEEEIIFPRLPQRQLQLQVEEDR